MDTQQLSRRNFLYESGKYSATTLLAFAFGAGIRRSVAGTNGKIALVYATRYGATKDIAHWIAEGIHQPISVFDLAETDTRELVSKYDRVILGSPIFTGEPVQIMLDFMKKQAIHLDNKVVATFVVCGTRPNSEKNKQRIAGYLASLNEPLIGKPLLTAHFGGRMILDKLTDEHRESMRFFYKNILKRELVSWDRTDPEAAKRFGTSIRRHFSFAAKADKV
uniref:Menaquinone-dependent protoporphyrinogen oxidase n=1 Tax=Candidatus Kentrum sp. FM TaxID=2126340 RepID=A0A450T9V6_9GAMM|nr:MAG: menaquinone-dependent protoporphyrinogen oxidase [Candidatus Kentron sp. FM]VFJ63462.1 MAG: menaquinone-dependent protoporphyrinogen oxidase [Candidatus Kentron sp. FM]VFK12295.1 MAG: menaquinone-dependent protoporphyrinogen oxidase [Candidatus Kentron sp. FM]